MTDHPLTEGRAWDIYSDAHPVDAIRAAFDAGRKYERAATKENLAHLRDTPAATDLMHHGWAECVFHLHRHGVISFGDAREAIMRNPYRDGDA